tara:strand:+ start:204 stop:692 length:489 start_codon:yes stop_codon:yes gene_type:complete
MSTKSDKRVKQKNTVRVGKVVVYWPEEMPEGIRKALYSKSNYHARREVSNSHPEEFEKVMEGLLPMNKVQGTSAKFRTSCRLAGLDFLKKTYPQEFKDNKVDALNSMIETWKEAVQGEIGKQDSLDSLDSYAATLEEFEETPEPEVRKSTGGFLRRLFRWGV